MDSAKVAKAAAALQKYQADQKPRTDKKPLFGDDPEPVYLVIRNKRYFSDSRAAKPKLVPLPHNIWGADNRPSMCIFTRDPQRAYKDALGSLVDRVVGVSKLRGKFKPYEARRNLKASYDLFLAEDDILPMLPKLLGKTFYGTQAAVPVPVTVRKKDDIDATRAGRTIERVLNSTVVVYPASTVMLVRIGTSSHSPAHLAANAEAVAQWLAQKLPQGFDSIRSLSIKTKDSPSLPVYYTETLYTDADIGDDSDIETDTPGKRRAEEDAHLDELLAEVVDEADIAEYNRETKRRRKQSRNAPAKADAVEDN